MQHDHMFLQIRWTARAFEAHWTLELQANVRLDMRLVIAESTVRPRTHAACVRYAFVNRKVAFQVLQETEPLLTAMTGIVDFVIRVSCQIVTQDVRSRTKRVRTQMALQLEAILLQIMREKTSLLPVEACLCEIYPLVFFDVKDKVISYGGLGKLATTQATDDAFVV